MLAAEVATPRHTHAHTHLMTILYLMLHYFDGSSLCKKFDALRVNLYHMFLLPLSSLCVD